MTKVLKFGKKSLAVVLCILMLLPFMFADVFAAELIDETLLHPDRVVTGEKYYNVTKGIVEKQIVLNNGEGVNQIRNYVFEVDLSNKDLTIVAGYNKCDGNSEDFGMVTLPEQAAATEKVRGLNVVAAVNGAGYNTKTGEPAGILIMDGKLVHKAGKHSFFAILNDGTAVIRKAGERTDDVKEAIAGMVHTVDNGKPYYTGDTVLHPRTAVGIKADGTVVFMVSDGRQSPDSYGMTVDEQTDTMIALGCVDVLSLDGGGSSTFMTQREAMSDLAVRNNPCYGFNRPIATSLMVCSKAEATDVFDHITFNETLYRVYPYHFIDIKMAACDENGFEVEMPKGKLVLENEDYGVLEEGNRFVSNGKIGKVNLNYVSDDGEIIETILINVTFDTENIFESGVNEIFRIIGNIIEMFKFVLGKLMSYLDTAA